MKRHLRLVSGLLLVAGGIASSVADPVDDLVQAEMRRLGAPGVLVGIMHRGKEVKVGAYGVANVELNTPVTRDSVFEIGSLTTQFTAAAILLLVEEGKIALGDPITRHLRDAPAAWNEVTVRHLLQHTSGIRTITGQKGFELARRLTRAQFIEQVGAWPLESVPGDKYSYSVTGYILLGHMIENVSGRSYWDFLATRIFRPLGMNASGDREPRTVIPHRVSGYEKSQSGVLMNRDILDLTDMFSAGAMVTSLSDLFKWDTALNSDSILSASSRQLMFTPSTLNNGKTTSAGLGCRLETFQVFRLITNSGMTSGFSASYERYPDIGLCIVVLANTSESRVSGTIARSIATSFLSGQ